MKILYFDINDALGIDVNNTSVKSVLFTTIVFS